MGGSIVCFSTAPQTAMRHAPIFLVAFAAYVTLTSLSRLGQHIRRVLHPHRAGPPPSPYPCERQGGGQIN